MQNHESIYKFNHTMNATVAGNCVLIGTSRENTFQFDLEAVTPGFLKALNTIGQGGSLSDIIEDLSRSEKKEFLEFFHSLEEKNIVVKDKKPSISERYDRQINYFYNTCGCWEKALAVQRAIESSRVAIIGLGGVGSCVLYNLASMGVGYIKAYDFDVVELSNISRQPLYTTKDVGQLKTEVAKEKIQDINPSINFDVFTKKITSLRDAQDVFEDVDLVISVADHPRPQFIYTINEAAFLYKKPVLFGGSAGSDYIVGPLYIPGKTLCYKCVNSLEDEDEEKARNLPFVSDIRAAYTTTLINPFNAMAASLMSVEAIKFLSSYMPHLINGVISGNTVTHEQNIIINNTRRISCELCK